jgi:hypothetical protein
MIQTSRDEMALSARSAPIRDMWSGAVADHHHGTLPTGCHRANSPGRYIGASNAKQYKKIR